MSPKTVKLLAAKFIITGSVPQNMIQTVKKVVCPHEYEVRSVETTDFIVFERCSYCGKRRERDGAELTADHDDTPYNTAS